MIKVFLTRALESEIQMIANLSISGRTLFSLCVVAVLGLIGCSPSNPAADSNQTQAATTPPEVSIQLDGSSTVFPLSGQSWNSVWRRSATRFDDRWVASQTSRFLIDRLNGVHDRGLRIERSWTVNQSSLSSNSINFFDFNFSQKHWD